MHHCCGWFQIIKCAMLNVVWGINCDIFHYYTQDLVEILIMTSEGPMDVTQLDTLSKAVQSKVNLVLLFLVFAVSTMYVWTWMPSSVYALLFLLLGIMTFNQ